MARPKLPRKLQIGAHSYTVQTSVKVQVDDVDGNGYCDIDNLVIRVRKWMRRSKAQETLLHECLHACIGSTDIKGEEKFVTACAPVLLQVIRENPELIKWLTHKE